LTSAWGAKLTRYDDDDDDDDDDVMMMMMMDEWANHRFPF